MRPEAPSRLRSDAAQRALVFAFALALYATTSVLSARSAGSPLADLGVYFDGHLYIEIAKSFPLPYSEDGPHYWSHAPGYPGVIALLRWVVPSSLANWGLVALVAAWVPAALAAVVFYEICREVGCPPLLGALLFAAANPRFVSVASTAHAEPLAVLLATLALLACLRDRLPACATFLALAVLTRFPAILLGLPIAFAFVVVRRRTDLRTLLLLATPLLAFAALNLYLFLRVPGFEGLWQSHEVFWNPTPTWPFAKLIQMADPRGWDLTVYALTYATLAACLAAIAAGLWPGRRDARLPAVWVAAVLLFHVSLGGLGPEAAKDFARLVILAWPAIALIGWQWLGPRTPPLVGGVAALALAVLAASVATRMSAGAVEFQSQAPYLPGAILRLHEDEPYWQDLGRSREAAPRRGR